MAEPRAAAATPASPALGRRPPPPLPPGRGLDVRPPRQRLRRRAPRREVLALTDFLTDVLLKDTRDTIAVYNVATGVRFTKRGPLAARGRAPAVTQKDRVLAALERLLVGVEQDGRHPRVRRDARAGGRPGVPGRRRPRRDRHAAPLVVPARDREGRQRRPPRRREPDGPVAEARVEPEGGASSRSRCRTARRGARPRSVGPDLADRDADRYADVTAGLKAIQIAILLTPAMSDAARAEADRLIAERKREILERECFGLVEFVEPEHGFEVVGGMEEVKKDLLVDRREHPRGPDEPRADGHPLHRPDGHRQDVRRRGVREGVRPDDDQAEELPSKWVGATEGNLEKILIGHQGDRPGRRHHRRGRPRVRQHGEGERTAAPRRASSRASRSSCPTRRTAGASCSS